MENNGPFTKPMVYDEDVFFDSCESSIVTAGDDSNDIDRVFPLSAKALSLLKTIVREFDDCHCRSPLCDMRVSEMIKHFESIAGNDVNEATTTTTMKHDRGSLACTVKRLIGFYQSKLLKAGVGTSCPSFVPARSKRMRAAATAPVKSPSCRTPRRKTPRRLVQLTHRSNSPRLSAASVASSTSSSSSMYAKKDSPRRSRLDLDRSTISVARRSLNMLPSPEKAAIRPVSEIRKCYSPGLKKQQQQKQKKARVLQDALVPSILINDSSTKMEKNV